MLFFHLILSLLKTSIYSEYHEEQASLVHMNIAIETSENLFAVVMNDNGQVSIYATCQSTDRVILPSTANVLVHHLMLNDLIQRHLVQEKKFYQ